MATDTQRKKKERQMPSRVVEFTAAAHEHTEPAFDTTAVTVTNAVPLGPFDVPAYGYLRHVAVLVTVSAAGALGTGVLHEDFPFNIIDEVALLDVNGAPIAGPFTGFDLFLANLFGGYSFVQDPRMQPDFSAAYTTASFMLRIPVEISHNNALGALANQNSAAAYKVRITQSALATQLSTVGTATVNTYRYRGILEAWSQPTPTDLAGRAQAMVPPRHGTTQLWSVFQRGVTTGALNVLLPRVGNMLRTIIVVLRTGAPRVRSTANLPDPIELRWDARQLKLEPRFYRRAAMAEGSILAAAGLPAGVLAFPFSNDIIGHIGDGTPELWIPTVQSSRLEVVGTYGADGDLRVLTNDVQPVEVTQAERFQEQSETGFQPAAVGVPVGA